MAFDYIALRDETVEPLLEEFGKDAVLYVNDLVSGAPYESQLGSEALYPVTAVQTRFKKDNNNGTLVEANDVLYIVSTKGIVVDPELADRFAVNDVVYQVVRIDPLQPGSVTMFWYVHARK